MAAEAIADPLFLDTSLIVAATVEAHPAHKNRFQFRRWPRRRSTTDAGQPTSMPRVPGRTDAPARIRTRLYVDHIATMPPAGNHRLSSHHGTTMRASTYAVRARQRHSPPIRWKALRKEHRLTALPTVKGKLASLGACGAP
jgi:hypothetical protein